MRTPRLVIAAIIGLVGILWIGQGSGVLAGSAMSGSPFWLAVGVVLVAVAVVIVVREARARPSA